MKQRWQASCRWFVGLSLRERALVSAALLLSAGLLVYDAWLAPALLTRAQLLQQLQLDTGESARIRAQQGELARHMDDPDKEAREVIAQTRAQTRELRESLWDLDRLLVAPARMGQVLDELLQQRSGVRVLRLETRPVRALEPDKPGEGLFAHSLVLEVEGRYGDLVGLLDQLEQRPVSLFRERAVLTAREDGLCRLKLELYTLSLDATWLAL
jgi:MSHA biogenesis protein MshJ